MAAPNELEHAKSVWSRMQENPDFAPIYAFLLSDAEITSASRGQATMRLTLSTRHVNSRGTIHGAVTATIVDWAGGVAISTHGLDKTGASVVIHVSYLGTAAVGETVEVESRADKVGRKMCFTTIRIYVEESDGSHGRLVATASHTKYIASRT